MSVSATFRLSAVAAAGLALLAPAVPALAEPLPGDPAGAVSGEARPAPPAEGPASGSSTAAAPEVKRILFLPETVKAEIREEIKKEVLAQAKEEGWAAPHRVPAWLSRLELSGDVRGRFERTVFPAGNASSGEFPDFAAINAGSPFDVNFVDVSGERYLDVDRNRSRPRLRARLAVEATVARGLAAGMRLATGEGSSPVSTNQTLGLASSGGEFSKYPVWLDRAFIRLGNPDPPTGLALDLGRFANPFFRTPLLWAEAVNLDGVAARGSAGSGTGFTGFVTGGAFPIYTTAFAFPAERTAKLASLDKWLFAAQLGSRWRSGEVLALTLGAALYDFYAVEGRASGPCDTHLKNVTCDTDARRPLFAQRGNTFMALRTPSDAALVAEAIGSASRYQYFGLASSFRELVGTGRLEVSPGRIVKIALDGELVRNLGFRRSRIAPLALNNRARCDASGCERFAGGSTGYLGRLTVGSRAQTPAWSWSASVEYRYLESDAAVDAFTDPDFALGGTNLKGFMITSSLTVAEGLVASARWSSADAIAGPTYRVDQFQIDLSQSF